MDLRQNYDGFKIFLIESLYKEKMRRDTMKKKILSYFLIGMLLIHTSISTCAQTVQGIEMADWNAENPKAMVAQLPNDPAYYEDYCDKFFEENRNKVAGASVAVVKDGKIIFEKGYGYSDIEKGIPSDPANTIYEYGSVTKLFTWVSLMQLKEQGKLSLEDPVKNYLDKDFKLPKKFDKDIRIIDLMNHQAGYDDYMIHLFSKQENLVSLRESLQEHKVTQVAQPGFAISYSNYGAGLAGYLVECVAGKSNDDYVNQNIFQKCGMTSTFVNPDYTKNQELWAKKAVNYGVGEEGFTKGYATQVSMYPAGAGNGTIEDLARFAMAMLDTENHPLFLERATQLEMLSTSYQPFQGVAGTAHGFFEYEGCVPVFWHNGETAYACSFLAIAPEADFGIVICTNCENEEAIQSLGMQIIGKSKEQVEQEVTLAEKATDEYVDLNGKLNGYYLDFRESHKGIQKLLGFYRHLFPIKIKEIDHKHIEINDAPYVRVDDYIYEDATKGTKMGITVKDEQVIKFTEVIDYVKIPTRKVVIAWIELVWILIALFIALIQLVRFLILAIQKKLTKRECLMTTMVGGEVLIGIFIVAAAVKLLGGATLSQARPFLIGNIILGIAIAYGAVTLIVKQYKDKKRSKWVMCFSIATSILLVIGVCLGIFSGC